MNTSPYFYLNPPYVDLSKIYSGKKKNLLNNFVFLDSI